MNDYLVFLFNSTFSDKSYGYRPNKGPRKAINRVNDFIKRGKKYILKTDINDFFETIDHNLLICMLKEKIQDSRIIDLIMMYLEIGSVSNLTYQEHTLGVYQGNIISPVLSNIYLDKMDKFLERHQFSFVRFADDFVILSESKNRIKLIHRNLSRFLKIYSLSLNKEKTYITSADYGFSFLGIYFTTRFRTIDKDKVEKIENKMLGYANLRFDEYIDKMNLYYNAIKNYYLKISPNNKLIKSAVVNSATNAITKAKKDGTVKQKSVFKQKLYDMLFFNLFLKKNEAVNLCISKAYNKLDSVKSKIDKKKKEVEKKLYISSVIHVDKPGTAVGISKNRITIKRKRKTINSFPIHKTKRIIIEGNRFSLSGFLISRCAKQKIFIDFIDSKHNPYASISFYNASVSQMIHKQALTLNTSQHLNLAKSFIYGKLKNQRNYLKYLNKYHKAINEEIRKLQNLIAKVKPADNVDSLLGLEGASSSIYWTALSKISGIDFKRVTRGAKDEINSSLNYSYAILYGKVQEALIRAGLCLHISFLHAINGNKPTLVFDLIEEFRTFVVDRTIFSMVNKKEKISLNSNGFLATESRKNIAKNIHERLGSYVRYRKQSRKLENVIYQQALNLKNAILNDKKYKPFIGRY